MRENREKLEALWRDPDHWSGAIYFCKEDPRLWVPKRITWTGWTFNFGHRRSTAALLAVILLPFAILLALYVLVLVPGF